MQANAALLTVAVCCCTLAFTRATVWPCFRPTSSLRLRSLLHAREVKDPVTILLNIRFSSVFCHLGSRRLLLVTPYRLSDESLLTNFSEQTADTWQSNVRLSDWPRAADVTNSPETFDHDVSSLVGQLPAGEEFVVTMATCYVGNCRGVVMGDAETAQEMPAGVEWWKVMLGVAAILGILLLILVTWICRKVRTMRLNEHYENFNKTSDRTRKEDDTLPDSPEQCNEYDNPGNPDDAYDVINDPAFTQDATRENDANRNPYLEAGNQRNQTGNQAGNQAGNQGPQEQGEYHDAVVGQENIEFEMETEENNAEQNPPNAWHNVDSAFHDDTQENIEFEMETEENNAEQNPPNAGNNVNSTFYVQMSQMEIRNLETNA